MRDIKFNLSDDLKKILKLSRESAVNNNQTIISIDLILSIGIKLLIEDKSFSKRDKDLSEYLSDKISIQEIENLVSFSPNNETKDFFSWSTNSSDSVPLSKETIFVLNNIKEVKGSLDFIYFKDFLYYSLIVNLNTDLINYLNKYISVYDSFWNEYKASQDESNYIKDFTEDIDDILDMLGKKAPKTSRNFEESNSWNNDPKKDDTEFEKVGNKEAVSMKKIDPNSETPFLDEFSTDMTKAASEGKYDPVIGRDSIIDQIYKVIACRKKNSVALLGDPGCGKSAIAEELAQRIASKNCPELMKQKRLLMLDVNSMVAGTQFRGQFEQRVQGVLKECIGNKDIIIFIDEFHSTLSAGGNASEGNGLGQLLKPALSRGEITCIASTTQSEYSKFVEKDGALKRRFQNIIVTEPSTKDTLDILKGLKDKYSEYHKVKYTDEVLEACVKFSDRYIFNRYFPDKAIDLMDISGSISNLSRNTDMRNARDIEKKLNDIISKKISCICDECNFSKASDYLKEEKELTEKLNTELDNINKLENNKNNWPEVTINDVASIVSEIAKIPVSDILGSDISKLKTMKDIMKKEVIGQDKAIDNLITSLQLNCLGLRDENKPIASFLFLGKTGLGKTYICQKLAENLFGSKDALITYAMGEMSNNEMSVSAFKGASSGYIGYGDSDSTLFEKVRKRPHSVVLFDEVEKANPKFFDMLLNILQEGWTTLSNGQLVSFRNTIIILTGNLGTKELLLSKNGFGFNKLSGTDQIKKDEEIVINAAKKYFRPEFLNRLSGITVFRDFNDTDYSKIFDLEINKVKNRLLERGFNITVTSKLKNKIISSINKDYGARDLTREINKWIQVEICKEMLNLPNPDKVGKSILADLDDNNEKVTISFS